MEGEGVASVGDRREGVLLRFVNLVPIRNHAIVLLYTPAQEKKVCDS